MSYSVCIGWSLRLLRFLRSLRSLRWLETPLYAVSVPIECTSFS